MNDLRIALIWPDVEELVVKNVMDTISWQLNDQIDCSIVEYGTEAGLLLEAFTYPAIGWPARLPFCNMIFKYQHSEFTFMGFLRSFSMQFGSSRGVDMMVRLGYQVRETVEERMQKAKEKEKAAAPTADNSNR